MNNVLKVHMMVAEFNRTFSASMDPNLWVDLILEESAEFVEAFDSFMAAETFEDRIKTLEHTLKEHADLAYVTAGYSLVMSAVGPASVEKIAQTPLDLVAATAQRMTLLADFVTDDQAVKAIELVHESNMSKLDLDGNPVFREDGKVLKGPNYQEPDLSGLVREIMMGALGDVEVAA